MVKKKGMTLTEIMITVAIFGLVISAMGVFRFARKTEIKTSRQTSELHDLWKCVVTLNKDLRSTTNIIEIGEHHLYAYIDKTDKWLFYVNNDKNLVKTRLKGFNEQILARNVIEFNLQLVSHKNRYMVRYYLDIDAKNGMYVNNSVILRYMD